MIFLIIVSLKDVLCCALRKNKNMRNQQQKHNCYMNSTLDACEYK